MQIPCVDLAPLVLGKPGAVATLAEQMAEVYSQVGFAAIKNHAVPQSIFDRVFEISKAFHALPMADKMAIKQNKFFRGYVPFNVSTLKDSTLGVAKKPNQSESFIMMSELDPSDPNYGNVYNLAGPNQWPAVLPEMREILLEYHDHMMTLSFRLLQIFAHVLGLSEQVLRGYFS